MWMAVFARGVQMRMGWEDDGKQTEEETPEGLSILRSLGVVWDEHTFRYEKKNT